MSFFKRAVVGALERREEVRAANEVKYESDVARGITKLEEAEKEMKKNNLIVRNRKKLIAPIGINVFNETGKQFDDPVLLNVLMSSKGDTALATDTLIRMAKNQAPTPTTTVTDGMEGFAQESTSTRDLSDMSGDTTKALQDASSMISTTSTQLPSQQKAMITAKESERTQRYGGGVAGNIMNTLLGGVSGPSVREAVKERYSSMFRTPEEGEQTYSDVMDYMEEIRTKGEASTVPDLPPKLLADIQMQTRKAKKFEKFEKDLIGTVNEALQPLKNLIVKNTPNASKALALQILRTKDTGGYESEMNQLPETVKKQIKEFMNIKKETLQGSTSIFNNTGNNSAYSSSQKFLYTSGDDGKNQMDIFFGRMSGITGSSSAINNKVTSASKQPSKFNRRRGNEQRDLSNATSLSTDQLFSMSNVDNKDDFQKKYKDRFLGIIDTEAGKAHLYNVNGTTIAIGNGFKTIKQLSK
tara:strand:+ start:1454 stop:2863 length:1410 start_codon:yes stop_codon:yes gene_type:complete